MRIRPSITAIALAVLIASVSTLSGQQPAGAAPANPAGAAQIFAVQCAGCHGTDAHGTNMGPALAGNRGLSRRSTGWIRNVIHNGIPSGGMPAFNLPGDELDALATFIHSLNTRAAEATVPGDRAAGEQYFFGEGKCSSCHMVDGRGEAVGPDLSDIANNDTLSQLRGSLLQPSARIAPGYELVTVHLRDGKIVRGFARSRNTFEIIVQDLKGQFHLLQMNEVSAVQEGKQSLMPPVEASPKDLQNLIAYLSGLTGVKPGPGVTTRTSQEAGISWSRILHPRLGDWLTYNGQLNGNRYSPLAQINTRTANELRLKWIFTIPLWKQFLPDTPYVRGKHVVLEATPLVADGIMYVTGPHEVFALDAQTGQEIWNYWRVRPAQPSFGDSAVGKNRGVAILGDKVFMITNNAHLIALNRTTGKLLWEVVMAPKGQANYGSTVAPLVVKDMVIAGMSGGDWPGVRGSLAAYKASTGELVWRFQTIPEKGGPGSETWGGSLSKDVGGAATWVTGSYDPETDTLYWTTGNPYPDSNGQVRPGANLYSNCILALNPDNGKLKWYYQVTPHDTHDWDATAPLVLVDTKYQGRQRKLLLFTNKNGFFYVLDRTNGHILLAKPFVKVNWASGIGADGRPELLPEDGAVCPRQATNWDSKAFSPLTRLYYVRALEKCRVKLAWKAGHLQEQAVRQYVRALDIESGKVAWEEPQVGPNEGTEAGILATAGGLLFYGDASGHMVAANARDGKVLWYFSAHSVIKASPMTYRVNGNQYVALAVGPTILCFGLP